MCLQMNILYSAKAEFMEAQYEGTRKKHSWKLSPKDYFLKGKLLFILVVKGLGAS